MKLCVRHFQVFGLGHRLGLKIKIKSFLGPVCSLLFVKGGGGTSLATFSERKVCVTCHCGQVLSNFRLPPRCAWSVFAISVCYADAIFNDPTGCPGTSQINCQHTLSNPEEGRPRIVSALDNKKYELKYCWRTRDGQILTKQLSLQARIQKECIVGMITQILPAYCYVIWGTDLESAKEV